MNATQQAIRLFLLTGARTSQELAQAAKISQPTVSRALSGLGEEVVRIGRGPQTRYALCSEISSLGSSWPLFLIGEDSSPSQLGRLHSLAGGGYWLERESPESWPSLLGEEFKDGVFPGLPWFLDDARPQGFLGRVFAKQHGSRLGEGGNPALWSNPSVLESLIRFGHNLPGAFVLGNDALKMALSDSSESITDSSAREQDYPVLASSVLQGNIVGSSAGGEQPKFTTRLGADRNVLVKFSLAMERPEGLRWADLLTAEKLALDVLSENGIRCPSAEVFDFENRRFLEVERFDRTPAGGRIPTVSLQSFDAAFLRIGPSSWSTLAASMEQLNLLSSTQAQQLSSIWRFGQLIGNTDMHLGNISFLLTPKTPLTLAPVYDMLPMIYRPGLEGQIPERQQLPEPSSPREREAVMAREFWERVARHPSISASFQETAASHAHCA